MRPRVGGGYEAQLSVGEEVQVYPAEPGEPERSQDRCKRWVRTRLTAAAGVRLAVGAEVLDVERQHLVERGWGIGLADVPVVAGWSVQVRGDRFVGIRSAGGADDYWTAPDPMLMPEAWQRAASDHGQVVVLVVSPGALDDIDASGE